MALNHASFKEVFRFLEIHCFAHPWKRVLRLREHGNKPDLSVTLHCPTRHGDVVFQVISSFVAQSVDLSVWQDVQGLGILYLSVIAGEMNLKVCELTNAPGTPWVSSFGIWHATH